MRGLSRSHTLSFLEWVRASTMFMRSLPFLLAGLCHYALSHTFQQSRKSKCPRCGKRLSTAKAQQCLDCGLRWHGLPRPDARSQEFANWPHERNEHFREAIRELTADTSSLMSEHWRLCVWRVVSGRWREREAWAAAGVGSVDICELKRLIKSHGFKYPIIGIERISENELQINVGWQAAPLMGAGTILVVRCEENRWRIVQKTGWIS